MAEGWSENVSSWNMESQPLSSIPCRYFKLGKCTFGGKCRYLHEDGTSQVIHTNWVNAPEFIPGSFSVTPLPVATSLNDNKEEPSIQVKSYAKAVDPKAGQRITIAQSNSELCPYYLVGECRYAEECAYIHGEFCELCSHHCLHPSDEAQRQQHIQDCMQEHKVDMERSFAIARSKEKSCGICMETIWEKLPAPKQRFGLLPNCSHCFCLDCIRQWRQEKQFENKIIRSCPECRVQSDFVCPSRYWCETKEEKEQLIQDYKKALSNKGCKYFNQGQGECPFGNRCFYLHALPDGTKADVGPPQGKVRRRRLGADEDEVDVVRFLLWDFLEERDSHYNYMELSLDMEELGLFPSDSDDDFSDDQDILFFH